MCLSAGEKAAGEGAAREGTAGEGAAGEGAAGELSSLRAKPETGKLPRHRYDWEVITKCYNLTATNCDYLESINHRRLR